MAFRFSFENPYFEGVDTTSTTKVKMFDNHKAREQVFNQENLQLVNQYYNYMKFTEKLKNNTCNTYKTDIYEWFDYIVMYQDNKHIKNITLDEILDFLRVTQGENLGLLRRKKSVILKFLKYLYKKQLIRDNYLIKQLSDAKHITKE